MKASGSKPQQSGEGEDQRILKAARMALGCNGLSLVRSGSAAWIEINQRGQQWAVIAAKHGYDFERVR